MATATLVEESMSWWPPGTNLYHLSEAFDGHWYIAVTVPANRFEWDTTIHPSTPRGATIADPAGGGMAAQRRYPNLSHEQALAELGYEAVPNAD